MSVGYRIYRVVTDRAARVRLYATVAKQEADASRPIGTDPAGDHGLLFEYVTTSSALGAFLSPTVDGASFESVPSPNIPVTITNVSGTTGTVRVDLVHVVTE